MNIRVDKSEEALSAAAIMGLVVLLCFWGIDDIPFLSVNEARRAVTAREMYESGQWLLPYMNGKLYLAKPPLFNWLTLLPTLLLDTVSELGLRLPSAVFALSSCSVVYVLGKHLGGRRVGLYAAMILAANTGFSLFARRAEIEMSLTGLSLLSLLAAWHYCVFRPIVTAHSEKGVTGDSEVVTGDSDLIVTDLGRRRNHRSR
ncbi:ArnT family glycosyltransferase, partial [Aromatoleum bremense]